MLIKLFAIYGIDICILYVICYCKFYFFDIGNDFTKVDVIGNQFVDFVLFVKKRKIWLVIIRVHDTFSS